jgi:hypothetical protein
MRTSFRYLPLALIAFGALLAAPACAGAYRGSVVVEERDRPRDIERIAYDNGLRDGVRAGERDGRDRRRYEPSRIGDWRDGNNGYRRDYGDFQFYRRSYRVGFETGYSQGYDRDGWRERR